MKQTITVARDIDTDGKMCSKECGGYTFTNEMRICVIFDRRLMSIIRGYAYYGCTRCDECLAATGNK
jgi:hypothetical protein